MRIDIMLTAEQSRQLNAIAKREGLDVDDLALVAVRELIATYRPTRRRQRRGVERERVQAPCQPTPTRSLPDMTPRGLSRDRLPGSIEEARSMIAYNERILATSASPQRLRRAERMLANVRPVLASLEQEQAARESRMRRAPAPSANGDGYEVVWNGAKDGPSRDSDDVKQKAS